MRSLAELCIINKNLNIMKGNLSMKSKGISNQINYGDDNIEQPTEPYYDGFSVTFKVSIAYRGIHKSCLHQPKHETTKLNSGAGTFQNLQIQTILIVK